MADAVASQPTVQGQARRTVSGATRTLEMRQVDEINDRITRGDRVTAAELQITDLPAALSGAQLRRLVMEGSPSFPYLYGDFGADSSGAGQGVPLHTDSLRALSKVLHLHHHWGV